jgi:hypothetical protein
MHGRIHATKAALKNDKLRPFVGTYIASSLVDIRSLPHRSYHC